VQIQSNAEEASAWQERKRLVVDSGKSAIGIAFPFTTNLLLRFNNLIENKFKL
jgi:hypothetical protein